MCQPYDELPNGRMAHEVMQMQVRHKLFESTFRSWDSLCEEAAAFATTVGRERLINISVSQADTGGRGVIFVWYWD